MNSVQTVHQQPHALACHNTLQCIAIQSSSPHSPSSCHDTPSVLRPNASSQPLVTIHCCELQYNPSLANPSVTIQLLVLRHNPLLANLPLLSQYTWCIATQTLCNPLPHVEIQFLQPLKPPSLSQYNRCVVTHSTAYCMPKDAVSQYNFPLYCDLLLGQTTLPKPAVSQYNFPLYCDTVGQ